MRLTLVRPKIVIDLVAGMLGLLFDQLDGEHPLDSFEFDVSEAETDDLTKISGIGPAFARRLNEAGVTTYDQLAAMTADEVRQRTELAEWQGDPDDWINQARSLLSN